MASGRGGKRKNAGRPQKEPSSQIALPRRLHASLEELSGGRPKTEVLAQIVEVATGLPPLFRAALMGSTPGILSVELDRFFRGPGSTLLSRTLTLLKLIQQGHGKDPEVQGELDQLIEKLEQEVIANAREDL